MGWFWDHLWVGESIVPHKFSAVKVPQIIKILKAKSGAGLSVPSLLLELLTFTSSFAYSVAKQFPFSSYGESIFLAFQTFLITWMTIGWEVSQVAGLVFAAVFAAFTAITLSPATPISALYTLQTLNVPIVVSAKLLQIYANWYNGSTGQLSAITVVLFALGSTARIFTSIQETGDSLIIVTFLLSTLCNYILLAQVIYYWRSPIKSSGKQKPG
ncbi:Mannose-P-dolichol utilization defect 1 [Fasciola gigantica]|uniref:Mannose-P-dolichol utilization defect 1 protein homolog n=1 Tax=Fasciola gigantica TaxID=46835 RepID=A0A504YNV0_FASGI|nr:Mannose-P-dolichol utilization defect 1 [Fasciola gigantica]